jgi:hypothetical protein
MRNVSDRDQHVSNLMWSRNVEWPWASTAVPLTRPPASLPGARPPDMRQRARRRTCGDGLLFHPAAFGASVTAARIASGGCGASPVCHSHPGRPDDRM